MKFALSRKLLKHSLRWILSWSGKRRWIAKERAFVPLLGSGYGATLITLFEEPKITLSLFFKSCR